MKAKIILVALTGLLFVSCSKDDDSGPDKETAINAANLPVEIKNYVAIHFANHTIVKAVEDQERNEIEYEVYLSENIYLDFDSYRYVTEINGALKLPDSVIPDAILNYANENYPDQYITDWKWEDTYQQVDLNNALELVFTTNGEFIRIDID